MQESSSSDLILAETLNLTRLQRVRALLSPIRCQLFELIPYLFHYNVPELPGFVDENTPSGVTSYQATDEIELACLTANIPFFSSTYNTQPEQCKPQFEGIYCMGSSGSFGQNPESDVDIWLVYHPSLTCHQKKLVQQKTKAINQWFAKAQFEVNFYLIHPEQFHESSSLLHDQQIGDDHSGSIQHGLLLEEFYRSHIRLAGKQVAWWPLAQGNDLLSLGRVDKLPPSEYLGSALWQLYKGLEKPHKALLKLLMLEVYAFEHPNSQLISSQIWQLCQQDNFSHDNDAYLKLYQRIENYLLKSKDIRRLEITRRCFYLKTGVALSSVTNTDDWRVTKMKQLVESWSWPKSMLTTLDNAEHWNASQLQWFNQQLNELLLISYKKLLAFSSRYHLSDRIRVDELGLLARRLHSVFDGDDEILQTLNPLWSKLSVEPNFALVATKDKYALYLGEKNIKSLIGQQALKEHAALLPVIAWSILNRFVDNTTRWQTINFNHPNSEKISALAEQLIPLLKQPKSITKARLMQPWVYEKVIMVINFADDATHKWHGQELFAGYLNADIFSFGVKKLNMVSSVDLLCLNSWGEWRTYQFQSNTAILEAASFLALGLKRAKHQIQFEVVNCSSKLQHDIKVQVRQFITDIYQYIQRAGQDKSFSMTMWLGRQVFDIYINHTSVMYHVLDKSSPIFAKYQPREVVTNIFPLVDNSRISSIDLTQLPEIQNATYRHFAKGLKQYFLLQEGELLSVYVADEHNELVQIEMLPISIHEWVSHMSEHFLHKSNKSSSAMFNLPQVFILTRRHNLIEVSPYGIDLHELNEVM